MFTLFYFYLFFSAKQFIQPHIKPIILGKFKMYLKVMLFPIGSQCCRLVIDSNLIFSNSLERPFV